MPELLVRPETSQATDSIGQGLYDAGNAASQVIEKAGEMMATKLGAVPPPSVEQPNPTAVGVRVATAVPDLAHGPAPEGGTDHQLAGPAQIAETTAEQAVTQTTPVAPAPNREQRRHELGEINRPNLVDMRRTGSVAANEQHSADHQALLQRRQEANKEAYAQDAANRGVAFEDPYVPNRGVALEQAVQEAAAKLPAEQVAEPITHELSGAPTGAQIDQAVEQAAAVTSNPQPVEPVVHELSGTANQQQTEQAIEEAVKATPFGLRPDAVPRGTYLPSVPEVVGRITEAERSTETPTVQRLMKFIKSLKREYLDEFDTPKIVQRFDAEPIKATRADGTEYTKSIAIFRLEPSGRAASAMSMKEFRQGLTVFQSDLLDRLMAGEDVAFPEEVIDRLDNSKREISMDSPEAQRLAQVAAQLVGQQTAASRELAQQHAADELKAQKGTVSQAVEAGDSEGAATILKDGRAAVAGGNQERGVVLADEQTDLKQVNGAAIQALTTEAKLSLGEANQLANESAEKMAPKIGGLSKRLTGIFGALEGQLAEQSTQGEAATSGEPAREVAA